MNIFFQRTHPVAAHVRCQRLSGKVMFASFHLKPCVFNYILIFWKTEDYSFLVLADPFKGTLMQI